jgi:adenylate cyclase
MAVEIERKFLVRGNYKSSIQQSIRIIQGYLCSSPEKTVRVRIKGEKAFLTIKGKSNASGTSRYEWENEIAVVDAEQLLHLCDVGMIDKTRNLIKAGEHIFEVDEFHGDNEGLTIAEIELRSENESFFTPDWLGDEVTGDVKYYNAMLAKNPYKHWKKKQR